MNLTNNRSFGIEIECKGITMDQAMEAIRAQGILISFEGYTHRTMSHWKIVTDASVSNGFEVVSPVLSGQAGLEQVATVAKALSRAGAKVQKDCGLHVHVDARDLNAGTLLNIVKRYNKYEEQIDAFMPVSRRASNNTFCQPMTRVLAALEGVSNIEQVDTRTLVNRIAQDRFRKVNLTAFLRHGTVEFRHHSGTVDARKMANWIIFCINFVETSKVEFVREEVSVPGTVVASAAPAVSSQLRKNAIERKFAALAECLDRHVYRSNYISVSELARTMDVEESTVPNYISQFRARYPGAEIQVRRGRGYYRDTHVSLMGLMGLTASPAPATSTTTVTYRVVTQEDTGLFMGLEEDVVSYFQERAMDLSA